jgi:hypothetical protein
MGFRVGTLANAAKTACVMEDRKRCCPARCISGRYQEIGLPFSLLVVVGGASPQASATTLNENRQVQRHL